VVEPEQDRQEDAKRKRQEDLGHAQVPRVHDPVSPARGHKRDARRKGLELDVLHASNVDEPGEEDEGQRRAVVLEEDADRVREEAARPEDAAEVGDHEDEEGGDDGEVEVLAAAEPLEDLDALLDVDEGDVEAEDVAGEAGDVVEEVTRVCDGEDPVEDEGPSCDVGQFLSWEGR
jgi:hypothetical protein